MDLSINGLEFGIGVLLLFGVVAGIIFLLRRQFANKTNKLIKNGKGNHSSLIKKYPEVNLFQLSGTFIRIGFVCSIMLSILAFSWTTYDKTVYIPDYDVNIEDIDIVPPPTGIKPPSPPPPPPPPLIEAVEEEIIEEPVFEDMTIDDQTVNEKPIVAKTIKKIVKPAKREKKVVVIKEEIEDDHEFVVVEEMPRFPGCETIAGTDADKKQCAEKKMLTFIYSNIVYPSIARENGVEGVVVVRFIVEKDGSLSGLGLVRDIGGGCGEEAMRVLKK